MSEIWLWSPGYLSVAASSGAQISPHMVWLHTVHICLMVVVSCHVSMVNIVFSSVRWRNKNFRLRHKESSTKKTPTIPIFMWVHVVDPLSSFPFLSLAVSDTCKQGAIHSMTLTYLYRTQWFFLWLSLNLGNLKHTRYCVCITANTTLFYISVHKFGIWSMSWNQFSRIQKANWILYNTIKRQ